MKILVLNGSPRCENSNTIILTNAFIEGIISNKDNEVEAIDIIKKDIKPCRGCFGCWTATPGKCVIKDDMKDLLDKVVKADILIWSFPLYYYGMPSHIKAFMDRLLPLNKPYISKKDDGNNGHPSRFDLSSQKHVLISTCGFFSISDNYDGVIAQFNRLFKGKYEKILCPQGELFKQPFLEERKKEYLGWVRKAGEEFIENFKISDETKEKVSELLLDDEEQFISLANMHWDSMIDNDDEDENDGDITINTEESHSKKGFEFIEGMAQAYNKDSYKKDIILEMYFSDLNETYQLVLKKDKCEIKTSEFLKYTTRIETTFDVWKDISEGKINGADAFIKRKFKIKGNMAVLMKMDKYFK